MEVAKLSKDKNWVIINKDPSWVPGAPRKSVVTHFRLLTNPDCLRSHLYRIGITDSSDSGQLMTGEHLVACLALIILNSIVKKIMENICTNGIGAIVTDHVILNHCQRTWTTPELAPPLLTTTPSRGRFSSRQI
ncbi:hypothetical protein TNCV_441591 [Trichonephila clavipes]|nr:hypothetical protein TNCV_441591 [Trichonephila clavipes]